MQFNAEKTIMLCREHLTSRIVGFCFRVGVAGKATKTRGREDARTVYKTASPRPPSVALLASQVCFRAEGTCSMNGRGNDIDPFPELPNVDVELRGVERASNRASERSIVCKNL